MPLPLHLTCLDGISHQEETMHVLAQGAGQAAEGARVLIILAAIAVVAFWQALLRLLLAAIAIAILIAVGAGAAAVLHV
jgi:uroporphyrinogen-III synthase